MPSIDCVHYNVGKEVRTAIEKIGGTMPEDMPKPDKSIQQIEKEQIARLKAKALKSLSSPVRNFSMFKKNIFILLFSMASKNALAYSDISPNTAFTFSANSSRLYAAASNPRPRRIPEKRSTNPSNPDFQYL